MEEEQTHSEYVTAQEAMALLGVRRTRMTQLLKELPIYRRGMDRRLKLLRREDVERLAVELRAVVAEAPQEVGA